MVGVGDLEVGGYGMEKMKKNHVHSSRMGVGPLPEAGGPVLPRSRPGAMGVFVRGPGDAVMFLRQVLL